MTSLRDRPHTWPRQTVPLKASDLISIIQSTVNHTKPYEHLWKSFYNNTFNPKIIKHAICLWNQVVKYVFTKWMHLICICVCSYIRKQIKFGPQIQFMSLTDCAEIESTPYPDLHSHLLSFFLGIFFPDLMFALVVKAPYVHIVFLVPLNLTTKLFNEGFGKCRRGWFIGLLFLK